MTRASWTQSSLTWAAPTTRGRLRIVIAAIRELLDHRIPNSWQLPRLERPRSVCMRSMRLRSWPGSPALHATVLQDVSRRCVLAQPMLPFGCQSARENHIHVSGTCAAAGGCERNSELGTFDISVSHLSKSQRDVRTHDDVQSRFMCTIRSYQCA